MPSASPVTIILWSPCGNPRRGISLFSGLDGGGGVCAANQGMVFKVLSLTGCAISLFSVLKRVSFWTRGL